MQNTDLSHIDRLIDQHAVDAQAARQQADQRRAQANQKVQEGDPDGASYFENEIARFLQQADEHEEQVNQLQTQKAELENQLNDLQNQRTQVENEHVERLRQLDQEIARVRGSSMML